MADGIVYPEIVSRELWLAARKDLLIEEKRLTRERDALNAKRRRLPMVKIDKEYSFEGPDGRVRLVDIFDGKSQLFMGHFMFGPEWENGCPACTHLADEISNGHVRHLAEKDTAFAYVSRAPIAKIESYKRKRGWTFPWYSSFASEFNYDFHVTLDESKAPVEYNFKSQAELAEAGLTLADGQSQESPGFSVFLRAGDNVFHTYSTYARGTETFGGAHYMLDLTVWGRQEDFEDSPDGWPQKPTYG